MIVREHALCAAANPALGVAQDFFLKPICSSTHATDVVGSCAYIVFVLQT